MFQISASSEYDSRPKRNGICTNVTTNDRGDPGAFETASIAILILNIDGHSDSDPNFGIPSSYSEACARGPKGTPRRCVYRGFIELTWC